MFLRPRATTRSPRIDPTLGDDWDLTLDGLNISDGDGILCIVGISANDGHRTVDGVEIQDTTGGGQQHDPIEFIFVGENDNSSLGLRLSVWKLDNKLIESTEGDWEQIVVDFPTDSEGDVDHVYAYVSALTNQMPDNMVYRLVSNSEGTGTTAHAVNTFVLEPDAMVMTAHLWNNGSANTDFNTIGFTPRWEEEIGHERRHLHLFRHAEHPYTDHRAEQDMIANCSADCTSVSGVGGDRSDADIECTHGTPGTLDTGTDRARVVRGDDAEQHREG